MSSWPSAKARRVFALKRIGWRHDRTAGSHKIMKRTDGRTTHFRFTTPKDSARRSLRKSQKRQAFSPKICDGAACVAQSPRGGGLSPCQAAGGALANAGGWRSVPFEGIAFSNWPRGIASPLRPSPHFGACLGVGRLGALRLAFVMQLLALGDSDFALDAAVFQVNLDRDQGQPLFPRNGQQLVDFPPVEQQLAIADGRVVLAVAVRVLADMGVEQPGFVAQDAGVGFLELDFAVLGGLHLGAGEHHAALEALQQEIVVEGLPVIAEDLESGVFLVSQIDLNARKPNCVNEFRWV